MLNTESQTTTINYSNLPPCKLVDELEDNNNDDENISLPFTKEVIEAFIKYPSEPVTQDMLSQLLNISDYCISSKITPMFLHWIKDYYPEMPNSNQNICDSIKFNYSIIKIQSFFRRNKTSRLFKIAKTLYPAQRIGTRGDCNICKTPAMFLMSHWWDRENSTIVGIEACKNCRHIFNNLLLKKLQKPYIQRPHIFNSEFLNTKHNIKRTSGKIEKWIIASNSVMQGAVQILDAEIAIYMTSLDETIYKYVPMSVLFDLNKYNGITIDLPKMSKYALQEWIDVVENYNHSLYNDTPLNLFIKMEGQSV